jgi:acetyltransferase-like isoleucine patch superfamily enzyme
MVKKKIFKALAKMAVGYKIRIWLLRKCNYFIGEDVFIGEDLIVIDDLEDMSNNLIIEERVAISPRVTLVLYAVPNWSKLVDIVGSKKGKITIKNDAWIGTGTVILPNITIGEYAIVGANSLVTKDVLPYNVVGGVPAKKIKTLDIP